MKKLFSLILTLVLSVGTFFAADKVQIGDLYYYLNEQNKTAKVISSSSDKYSGDIVIPSSVEYNAQNYSVTSIGENAFYGCASLTSVTIPNSVTSIGDDAFRSCKGLTSVTIGNSVTSIGESAFDNCRSLTSVTIPNSVTSIGELAFKDCIGLTSIDIPNSVTSIGNYAFSGCSSLTSVTTGNIVMSLGRFTFYDCPINQVHFLGSIEDWCTKAWPGFYSSNYDLFIDDSKVTNVTIPNSITSIREATFRNCKSLTSVEIPNSVTSIGNAAFYGCMSLTSITIPNSVTNIGAEAFYYCTGLTSIEIPNSVTSIGESAFDNCRSLTTIYAATCGDLERVRQLFSNYSFTVKYLPSPYTISTTWTEKGYVSVPSYTICDEGVAIKAIPQRGCRFVKWADGNTENPRTIYLDKDTTMEAIFECQLTGKCGKDSALTWILDTTTLALNITGAGELTENYSYGYFIKSLVVDKGIIRIGDNAFQYCENLISVVIPNTIKDIGNSAFWGCSKLASIEIPNSVTSIGNSAFYGCSSISSVEIPNGIADISEYSFYGCAIENLVFSASVKAIGRYAFAYNYVKNVSGNQDYNTPSIKTITCYSMRPPSVQWGNYDRSFPENQPYSTIIYVPADYMTYYQVHDFWGLFDIRPIAAKDTETTTVQTTPTEHSVDVKWPSVTGAYTYELVIKDKEGNVICTLIFNSAGQLTSIAFNAPARGDAPQKTQTAGFSFTITGLEAGTSYDLTITAKNETGQELDKKNVTFHTDSAEGIEDIHVDSDKPVKVLMDGQIYILRGEHIYDAAGKMIK